MRDVRKIDRDIRYLVGKYGEKSVFWSKNYEWIGITNWILPPNMNKATCRIVVLLPENYGNGAPVVDSFIEPGLNIYNEKIKRLQGLELSKHYFSEYKHNPAKLSFGTVQQWINHNWWWLCLQDKENSLCMYSVINYLSHVFKFLNEPFKDWNRYFKSYGEK